VFSRLGPLVLGVLVVLLTAAAAVAVSSGDGSVLESTAPTTTEAPVPSTTTSTLPLFASVATPAPPPPTEPPPTEPPPPPPTTAAPKPKRAPAPQPEAAAPVGGVRCIVRLHGKGGGAGGTEQLGDGLLEVEPGGNASGWGGRQWVYFPESGYAQARSIVQQAIDEAGCGPVVLYGFSNGGAFAAKLYCRGETFGGRVRGVVIDDPVVDTAVNGCGPARGVRVALYWTGDLEATAQPGWDCGSGDWTCEGGTTIGIDAYQGALGVARKQSPNHSHSPYWNAPELNAWW
jgi:pimeloyl-ACP methyl ester carboxylesterase